ncbi:site-2 protease family protein [Bacillaceae bacterium]
MQDSVNGANRSGSQRKRKNGWWKWGLLAAFLLPKLKGILALLKLGKVGGTVISMFVAAGAYALLYPWQFAVGFVLMILIHELGHVLAAKRRGLPVSAPTFIPFLGALITMKRQPLSAETEAFIAYGGPLFGTLGALAAFGLGVLWESPLLYAVAMVGFFLNLINLLPIHPLDGGRIVTAVSRWFWLLGLVGGFFVIVYLKSILFFIIWLMFAWDLYGKYGKRRTRARVLPLRVAIPVEEFREAGLFIPGEAHRRPLPYSTFCLLADGQQKIDVFWPGLPKPIASVQLPPSIVKRAEMEGLQRRSSAEQEQLEVNLLIELEPYENERYYEVPAKTRWLYGIAYFGLAAFLLYMYFFVVPPYLPQR